MQTHLPRATDNARIWVLALVYVDTTPALPPRFHFRAIVALHPLVLPPFMFFPLLLALIMRETLSLVGPLASRAPSFPQQRRVAPRWLARGSRCSFWLVGCFLSTSGAGEEMFN
jgi:hypothetical protein